MRQTETIFLQGCLCLSHERNSSAVAGTFSFPLLIFCERTFKDAPLKVGFDMLTANPHKVFLSVSANGTKKFPVGWEEKLRKEEKFFSIEKTSVNGIVFEFEISFKKQNIQIDAISVEGYFLTFIVKRGNLGNTEKNLLFVVAKEAFLLIKKEFEGIKNSTSVLNINVDERSNNFLVHGQLLLRKK